MRHGHRRRAGEAVFTAGWPGAGRSPLSWAQILGLVPYGLGFTPDACVIVIGLAGLDMPAAWHLDLPGGPAQFPRAAAGVFRACGARSAAAACYGPPAVAAAAAAELRRVIPAAGLRLLDVVRVDGGRFWSLLRDSPPAGHPVEPPPQQLASGLGPVLPTRQDLAASLRPVAGRAGHAMAAATGEAERRAARLAAAGGPPALHRAGFTAAGSAVRLYRDGGMLSAVTDLAWLSVLLADDWVRRDAWARMDPAHRAAHRRLWTDLACWARPGYAAAPASLLAFTALQAGAGVLASLAIDRALQDQPGYQPALALRQQVAAGVPLYDQAPSVTPEQAGAAYRRSLRPGRAGPGHG